ncbi:aminotransferase class I/II-fold pyridoxal phosphate-dependent enzyme [Hymenobacter sp. 15J16-1T3B]|uniref:pyridoxal phosphate-dependent aminotransferase n=1 Tax=Hymenobacter sp. 15J16-1T3B TaxID=2886941 RepID=UPI001D0FC81C|nr:aminotransferase class I/II-fold pyridoxal phosphate-dependent enzyme [Hymenobacter sp. 15J16-1T3B]MCC3156244.1 aminotransferase class I/II-fold pyridoxal phosphate-dependent enzyme [Hymenobacter sp. 15J16-1T3B]
MNIPVAERLAPIQEYYFSQKLREIEALNRAGARVINLGIGSPDLPPHPSVVEALTAAAQRPDAHAYQSYKGVPALRQAAAEWYQRSYGVALDPETEVLPLLGCKEGIVHVCMTFLQPGDEALIPNPGYPTYRAAVQLSGATPVDYDLTADNGWLPDLPALARRDLSRVKLMWLNYPHMPTGARASAAALAELVAFAREHSILLVHDNPYSFILNDEPLSLLAVPGARAVSLELNSLSKSHNLAGWRVGLLAGRADLLQQVLRFKSNMDSGMFLPVQLAAAAALQLGPEWSAALNATYRARRTQVFGLLDALGCTYDPAQVGLFVWARVPAAYADGYALSDAVLARARVFITPGGIFGSNGSGFVRLSLCQPAAVLTEAQARLAEAGWPLALTAAQETVAAASIS